MHDYEPDVELNKRKKINIDWETISMVLVIAGAVVVGIALIGLAITLAITVFNWFGGLWGIFGGTLVIGALVLIVGFVVAEMSKY